MADSRTDIVIRRATVADARLLWRLAALDSAPAPHVDSDILIAEADGRPIAAAGGGRVVADPFRPTAEVVELLRVRSEQLAGAGRPPRSGRLLRFRPRVIARHPLTQG